MRIKFDPDRGHILVPTVIITLTGMHMMRLPLDTGSTHSVLSRDSLAGYGLKPDRGTPHRRIITGSGRTSAPTIIIPELRVGAISLLNFQVFAMDFPERAGIEGVLGLDFLRGRKVTLDFRQGLLDIE